MMATLSLCLAAQIFKTFVAENEDSGNKELALFKKQGWPKFLVGCCITLLPSIVYLFSKRVEDCLACFNKYTSRYSNYQFPEKLLLTDQDGYFNQEDLITGQNPCLSNGILS